MYKMKTLNLFLYCLCLVVISIVSFTGHAKSIIVGAEQPAKYLPFLQGKKVGLVVNQTSSVEGKHLVDFLISHDVDIKYIFSPEHGFRGNHDAGAEVKDNIDPLTQLPVISIYGKNKKPSPDIIRQLDVIIFDIQDVGVRFYTFLSSMHYMMEAAAEAGKSFIVFDRPNPNIKFVNGPILEAEFSSFVGMHPIPVLHGMTLGELAKMISGQGWLTSKNELDLHVISVKNYTRHSTYSLPIKPSPNLPNDQSIQLYPSLTFFESTVVSIGRGTEFPFQVIGHNEYSIGDFHFTPISMPGSALSPKLMDKLLTGQDLRVSTMNGLDLQPFIQWYQVFATNEKVFFKYPDFMDKLAGTDELRKSIQAGVSLKQIEAGWQQGLSDFKQLRAKYLLYPN
ncbi:DUF1343 domain-containing protein [Colwellia sp. 1_MG-2023]|uniref:exo-beta-N-acetylmuramidase NamZ family protein n=1 Tax=unclassified Colwellia TaxID=196834 RepID=UPI001C099AB9|nr:MULTISPECIES: DUF1343 domain-containing protein [unclassified Colwellia]MBU2923137.1 DUF1343 domain-containing protein [Colwellia sp. C2M11]MDO6651434.1 DUF1343 domain-containing protein [Colwellia sp. 3_MG-2023]MDO6664143.1 DUF1343 domain-containing protein [Colwellia sp. 2_MG-2023]MDO6688743.1 DUF1343 domain-containing protein [Colwellia sp. 1_MG-2023]